ncbi:VOC family protein [Moorena bouillonii]|uniref:VOC domain-containing protein n=1 Tax=Moorena bouillonii PNG TaxID=568701 RepID=A0A1U7N789_9CYAN|nr:VOC family protein [Moorena bouillonii]OLT61820.1 hypothetical protein BJP37_25110 [Moorena bouillonii PNG]
MTPNNPQQDERPPIWIGHVSINVSDFKKSLDFFEFVGMRKVAEFQELAVLELRGGTHLVLRNKPEAAPGQASFDLMVDDLKAQQVALQEAGYAPSEIREGRIHSVFDVSEPSGNTISFYDSHVVGPV